jgi:hypothetical protein
MYGQEAIPKELQSPFGGSKNFMEYILIFGSFPRALVTRFGEELINRMAIDLFKSTVR